MARKEPKIVVLIGPEGSGKSSVGNKLAMALHMKRISTGDTLRYLAKHDFTHIGQACRDMFEKHAYLDPDLLRSILTDRIAKPDLEKGFILDGGLRTVKETAEFRDMLSVAGRDYLLTVVHLRIPGWMGLERLVYSPNARKRDDDTPQAVITRLSKFYLGLPDRTRIIRNQPGWKLVHVRATGTLDDTVRLVKEALGLRPRRSTRAAV